MIKYVLLSRFVVIIIYYVRLPLTIITQNSLQFLHFAHPFFLTYTLVKLKVNIKRTQFVGESSTLEYVPKH